MMKLNRRILKSAVYVVLSLSFFYTSFTFAQSGTGISDIAANVTSTFSNFAKLITAGAFLAGLTFAFLAILQFKAHRDNPAQNPLGKPIVYMFVAVGLLFLPYLVEQAGKSVLGTSATPGTVSGVTSIE